MNNEHFVMTADALGARYRLERLLQSGVSAYVYVAEDRALGRKVAIKVLRDEMTATVSADRFHSEIEVARQLRHPNIVPMWDSGDIDGLPFYVMPFIEGETLRARLSRLGRLPLGDAIRIAEDIARALHFAHRHQVVHRDIKPENVMLDRGRALVLDFGIALALDALDAPRRTMPGLTLGTFQYMSPEQVDASGTIDGRSDIYSLACVIYEMLSGRPPFTGKPNVVIRRHLSERPRSLVSLVSSVPPRFDTAVLRALDKSPDRRYPTAGAFMTALANGNHRVRVIGRRVAVVPFVHLPNRLCAEATPFAPRVDAFSDGVGEEVADLLRDFEGVVIAPNVSADREAMRGSITHIARRTGGDVVLFGDVRESEGGDGLLLCAALYDGRSGRRLWSGATAARRRRDFGTPVSPARDLARAIAGALGVTRVAEREDYAGPPAALVALRPSALSGMEERVSTR